MWYAGVNSVGGGGRYRVELELPEEVLPGGGTHVYAWAGADAILDRRAGGGPSGSDPKWLRLARNAFWTTYPFDPDGISGLPLFLDELDLRLEGVTQKAGREAIRLAGVPVEEWEHDPEPLWWGADEYEVLVDAERGVHGRPGPLQARDGLLGVEPAPVVVAARPCPARRRRRVLKNT